MMTMYDMDEEEQSPTDTSEDSIEVRVKPVKSMANHSMTPGAKKNKRKSMEPKRVSSAVEESDNVIKPVIGEKRSRLNSTGSEDHSPPVSYNSDSRSPSPRSSPTSKRSAGSPICLAPKKRFKFDALRDLEAIESEKKNISELKNEPSSPVSPFRPWSESAEQDNKPNKLSAPPTSSLIPQPGVPYIPFLLPGAGLPLSLPLDPRVYPYHLLPTPFLPMPANVNTIKSETKPPVTHLSSSSNQSNPAYSVPVQDEPLSLVINDKSKIKCESFTSEEIEESKSPMKKHENFISTKKFNIEAFMNAKQLSIPNVTSQTPKIEKSSPTKQTLPSTPPTQRTRNDSGSTSSSGGDERAKQRNYKNMTRERRVEANARERQRVHTITAAFDNLQAVIPSEDENVKLSKLSVIKIATAYIMALSRMAGHDYTEDQCAPPVEDVIQHCSEVIETETRIKKRSTN